MNASLYTLFHCAGCFSLSVTALRSVIVWRDVASRTVFDFYKPLPNTTLL